MKCHGSFRQAKGTVPTLKYVLVVQLAKQDRTLPDNNVSALKTTGHYGDEVKLSEENETWSETSMKGKISVGREE